MTFLADHIDFTISVLHHHHAIEDERLYPLLAQRVPEQAEMVRAVEAQDTEVHGAIDAGSAACRAWRHPPSGERAEGPGTRLDELNVILQPHLDGEEGKVVPLAARHMSQPEWHAVGQGAVADIPRKQLPIAFGLSTNRSVRRTRW